MQDSITMANQGGYGEWDVDSPDLYLNPNETDLLINALNSNKPSGNPTNSSTYDQNIPSNAIPSNAYLDFDTTDAFDWDLKAISNGPDGFPLYPSGTDKKSDASEKGSDEASPEFDDGDLHDKRKVESPEEEDGSAKRQETGKKSQKPGRKPLTSEPTTKRKAQNRAAQRAFRERKEKHLKDLEDKADELQQKFDSTSSENALLKKQIERLQTELSEYRKRLSTGPLQTSPLSSNNASWRNSWDAGTNFNFEFPKFGVTDSKPRAAAPSGIGQNAVSMPRLSSSSTPKSPDLSNLFSADVLRNGEKATEEHLRSQGHASRSNSTNAGGLSPSNTASPASSGFNGFTSSCVTTPESSADIPDQRKFGSTGMKLNDQKSFSLSPTGPATISTEASLDLGSFDWLANQNGGDFNPQLFGDFREPQDNIMNNEGWYFNDMFNMPDLGSPLSQTKSHPKKTFMQEIEDTQAGKDREFIPKEESHLKCDTVWSRLSNSDKVLSGEADMDELCSQLKAKAKCSGSGPVIAEKDVNTILGPGQKNSETNFLNMFK